jgi:hypothetical protein
MSQSYNPAADALPDNAIPEIEIDELVSAIFSKAPGPPNSIVLQIANGADFTEEPDETQLRMFVDIAVGGIKHLWGPDAKPWELSRDQFNHLQRYMHSMGVALIIKCNEDNDDPWEAAENGRKVEFLRLSVKWLTQISL